jgi:hypothetical protein
MIKVIILFACIVFSLFVNANADVPVKLVRIPEFSVVKGYPKSCTMFAMLDNNGNIIYPEKKCDISKQIPKQKRSSAWSWNEVFGDMEYIYIYNNLHKVLPKKDFYREGDTIGYIDKIKNLEIIKVDCKKCWLKQEGNLGMYEQPFDIKTHQDLKNFNPKNDPIYEIVKYQE